MDLTKRSFLNSATAILGFVARIGTSFFVQPILVATLGERAFGTWQICQKLMDQMATTEGRSMQALKFTLAHKLADSDPRPKRIDVGSAIRIWTIFAPLQLAIGVAVVYLTPYFVDSSDAELTAMARVTLSILVVNLLLAGIMNLADGILVGENLNYRAVWLRIGLVVLNGILLVAAAKLGFGVPGLACAVVLLTTTTGISLFVLLKRFVPWLGVEWPSRVQLRKFFGFSGWVLVWGFVNRLLMAGDVIILGAIASPELVTHYVLTFYLMATGSSTLTLGVAGSIPSIGMIVGKGRMEAARGVRGEIMRLAWLLLTVLGGIVLLWNEYFMGLWVGEKHFAGAVPNLLIVILVAQRTFFRTDSQILDSTLDIRLKVMWGTLATLVSVGSAILLGREFGLPGLLSGMILGGVVLTLAFPILSSQNLQGHPLRQFLGVIRPGLASAAIFYGCWTLQPMLKVDGWISLFLYAGATAIPLILLSLGAGLNGAQRQQMVRRVSAMIPNRGQDAR